VAGVGGHRSEALVGEAPEDNNWGRPSADHQLPDKQSVSHQQCGTIVIEPYTRASARNPFSTSRVRPGAIPYCFPPGQSAQGLVRRLRHSAWQGQIIGPHGSGKSALLAALIPAIEDAGRRTILIGLHDGQRRLPIDLKRPSPLDSSTVLIVDGYEQLGRLSRFRLKRFCRRHGIGLLVTAHRPVGLPELFHTATSLGLAQQVVAQLLGERGTLITSEDVAERFSRHGGDLRETLFDLYDLYEHRCRRG